MKDIRGEINALVKHEGSDLLYSPGYIAHKTMLPVLQVRDEMLKMEEEGLVITQNCVSNPGPCFRMREPEKQAAFEECITQACVWNMKGDEIATRMEKAIDTVIGERQVRKEHEN